MPPALKNMPLNALDTGFLVSKLVAARVKIPNWLSNMSAMQLLVQGIGTSVQDAVIEWEWSGNNIVF
jgi:hypothetical protein